MIEGLNYNSPKQIREAGIKALAEALGPLGMVRFMQQFEDGHGDYTKEKYNMPDITIEEFEARAQEQEDKKASGHGDYTKEKYDLPDESFDEIEARLKAFKEGSEKAKAKVAAL